jgi:hypothetical protein
MFDLASGWATAHPYRDFQELAGFDLGGAPSIFALSHFRTENRTPLFLKML